MTSTSNRPALELAIVTGLSGAGRGTAAKCLEDLGWFVVDNLPPSLIPSVVELATRSQGGVDRVAAVIDVRSLAFTDDIRSALSELERLGLSPRIIFLEANDEILIRRFDGVRRPHPLQGDGTVASGIAAERERLQQIRGEADLIVDTTVLNVHELRAKIAATFGGSEAGHVAMTLMSFGYKYGLPTDADVVIDCRLLPNPHWVDELRPLSGLDEPVRDWVFDQPGAKPFVDDLADLLERYVAGYAAEGKHFATIAIGCTGGKHRSVAVTEELLRRLAANDHVEVHAVHRDLGRE